MSMILWLLGDAVFWLLFIAGAFLFLVGLFLKPILTGVSMGASLLASPLVTVVAEGIKIAAIMLMLYSGGTLFLRVHDRTLEASWEAAQRQAVASAVEAQRIAGDKAVADAVEATRKQTAATTIVRKVLIHDAAKTPDACPLPVALRDAHAELLRRQSCARGDQAGCAAGPAGPVQKAGYSASP